MAQPVKAPLKNLQPTAEYTRNKGAESDDDLTKFMAKEDENPQAEVGAIILLKSDVQAISKLLGVNLMSADHLIARVRLMTVISIDGLEITLSPALLHRLKTRAVRQTLGDYVKTEVVRLLNGAVGI